MHGLDFISDSPRTYIFQKGSNKTNLGGVLTLLFLFIFLLIFVAYILEYSLNEKYEFSYFHKQIKDNKERQSYLEDPKINPNINFTFDIVDQNGNSLEESYEIVEGRNIKNNIGRNKSYVSTPNNLSIAIAKKCENEDCTFNLTKRPYLRIYYEQLSIDHYKDESPVEYKRLNKDFRADIIMDETLIYDGYWQVYNYAEKRGLEKIYDYIFEDFKNYTFGDIDGYRVFFEDDRIEGDYKYFLYFNLYNDLLGIDMYTRIKKSLIDCLANIAALSTTIYGIMSKVFAIIYSRNFDNYKIIEKILSKEIKQKKEKEIELSDEIKYQTDIIDSNLENNLINKEKDENNSDNPDLIMNQEMDLKDEFNDEPVKLPKLRFFDFFFNNVYNSKRCVSLQKQKLISSCDNVLYKYFSIENILLNQLIFENLMKDYKWNNPKLKSIHRNELITEIKNYL